MEFITPRVAIGDVSDANNDDGLRIAGITAILNVAIDLESPFTMCASRKAGLICGPGNTIEMIDEAVKTAAEILKHNDRIMVFGHGNDARVLLVCAALKSYVGEFIEKKSSIVSGPNFESCVTWISKKIEFFYESEVVKEALLSIFGMWERRYHIAADRVSIVMPFYNNFDVTRRCIESIRETTVYKPYELIAVNDGSPPNIECEKYISDNCDLVVSHTEVKGTATARNSGMSYASGKYICQIDNDVIFFYGWLSNMLETLAYDPKITMVAPLFSSNHAYHALNRNSLSPLLKAHPEKNLPPWVFVPLEAATTCLLFEKSLLNDLGTFDEDLKGLWEDKDFTLRLGVYFPDSVICIDSRVTLYHQGYVDPSTGEWHNENDKNTRSLPELQDPESELKAMEIVLERWGVKHPRYDTLKALIKNDETEENP